MNVMTRSSLSRAWSKDPDVSDSTFQTPQIQEAAEHSNFAKPILRTQSAL